MPQPRYFSMPALNLEGKEIRLKYPLIKYGDGKRKVLLIADSLSVEDAEDGVFLAGRVGDTISNIFERAWHEEAKPGVRVVAVTTRIIKRPSKLSEAELAEDYHQIINRIVKLIRKWRPDSVVFLGHQSFLQYWRDHVRFTERRYSKEQLTMLRGRLLPAQFGRHSCQVLLSFSPAAFASLEYKDSKSRVNLIGFVLYDIAAAIRGNNRYTVPAPDMAQRQLITTVKEFDRFYVRLIACPTPSIDTESDNLNRVYGNKLFMILFTLDGEFTYGLPMYHPLTPFTTDELLYIEDKMRYYFEECRSRYIIFQNAKFDVLMFFSQLHLRWFNHRVFDLMAGEYFLDENRKFFRHENIEGAYTLEFISAQYGALGYENSPIAKEDRGRMAEFTLEQILEYGVFDVVYPYHISQFQIAEARRRGSQYHLYLRTVCELGSDMVLVFCEMERNGVLTDRQYLSSLLAPDSSLSQELAKFDTKFRETKAIQKSNAILCREAGVPSNSRGLFDRSDNTWLFDINRVRPQQVLFFDVLGLQPLEYRKDGGGKTNKAFLQEYKDTVEEVAMLADYRQHEKLRNTYVVGLLKQLTEHPDNATDGRLRANYGFIIILTVRSSATRPNLQNIPSRGKLAKIIKRLFIASRGRILLKVDYIAHEVRGWANISKDHRIAAAFHPGMQLRRKIRIIRGLNIDLDYEADAWLRENNWEAKDTTIEKKRELSAKTRNNPELYNLLQLLIELAIRGDVHRVNYEFFWNVPAANVTAEQRQGIKETVFGTIYDKQAPSLAATLFEKALKPIRRKYIFKMNRALLKKDMARWAELREQMNTEMRPYWEQAQELIDKLFNKFRRGGRWIKRLQAQAAEDLCVVSPFGAVRHLWGYLHSEFNVHKVMDRRGPNSVIQGPSSNLGLTGARQMHRLNWRLQKAGIDLDYKHCNFVHDSNEAETAIALLPLTLYYTEHAMTTQTHKRVREIYGFDMIVGLEIDMELGGSMATTQKWDGTEASLIHIVGSEIDWMRKELSYNLNKKELLRCVRLNYRKVNRYRIRELQAQGEDCQPAEAMLLTPEIAGKIDWILPASEVTEQRIAA